jgi:predicted nuclease of restriction endonuclease-like (RecB) superfamily
MKKKIVAVKKPPGDGVAVSEQTAFEEIVGLIEFSRLQAIQAVNTALIDLYWNVGEYISRKIQTDGWGKSTVLSLSAFVQQRQPGIRGFSPQNIWRMRQFFETYRDEPILSPLLREFLWSSNLHILSRAKRPEEREFYLRMASRHRWQVREVARQIDAALFERTILNPPILSTVLRGLHPQAAEFFKDIYSLEFLGLPTEHSEADLHGALLRNLGRFLTELGRDFCFIGSEHPIQVDKQDFAIDLLFFHRGLNCLIAIELKIREFRPEDLGKLNFYLEALDRDHRKLHENPSIGLLLCATKDQDSKAPTGRPHASPGHRPGKAIHKNLQALKGRTNLWDEPFHAKPAPWVALSGLDSWRGGDPGRCPGLAWGCPVGTQEGGRK